MTPPAPPKHEPEKTKKGGGQRKELLIAAAAVALLLVFYLRHKSAGASQVASAAADPTVDPATGIPYAQETAGGGSSFDSTGGGGSGIDPSQLSAFSQQVDNLTTYAQSLAGSVATVVDQTASDAEQTKASLKSLGDKVAELTSKQAQPGAPASSTTPPVTVSFVGGGTVINLPPAPGAASKAGDKPAPVEAPPTTSDTPTAVSLQETVATPNAQAVYPASKAPPAAVKVSASKTGASANKTQGVFAIH